MITLKYFPDETYIWKYKNCQYPRMMTNEAIAFGNWVFKLDMKEIHGTMQHMNIVHSVAEFDPEIRILRDIVVDKSNL